MSYEYFYELCLKGDRKKIEEMMITKRFNNHALNYGLEGACRGGHKEIVQLMLEKGAFILSWGMSGACRGKHKEIIQLLLEKKGTTITYTYLRYPRDKEIILDLIDLGMTRQRLNEVGNIEELYKELEKEVIDVLEEIIIKDIRNIIIKLIV